MKQDRLIKEELAKALHAHLILLKGIDTLNQKEESGLLFVSKSLGFMLERIPEALVSEDSETLYFAAFQYYNLLAELKSNLALSFPYLTSIDLSDFPSSQVEAVNVWWEAKTGLKVHEPTKQTMVIND